MSFVPQGNQAQVIGDCAFRDLKFARHKIAPVATLAMSKYSRLSKMARNRRHGDIENEMTSDLAILKDLQESREKSTLLSRAPEATISDCSSHAIGPPSY